MLWIIFIYGTNTTHEGKMCCVLFPGQGHIVHSNFFGRGGGILIDHWSATSSFDWVFNQVCSLWTNWQSVWIVKVCKYVICYQSIYNGILPMPKELAITPSWHEQNVIVIEFVFPSFNYGENEIHRISDAVEIPLVGLAPGPSSWWSFKWRCLEYTGFYPRWFVMFRLHCKVQFALQTTPGYDIRPHANSKSIVHNGLV